MVSEKGEEGDSDAKEKGVRKDHGEEDKENKNGGRGLRLERGRCEKENEQNKINKKGEGGNKEKKTKVINSGRTKRMKVNEK